METQGIVIWAPGGTGAMIVWCADNEALVYVGDRRLVGDRHAALCVGDFVDLRVDTVGAMRVGRDLRFRATGAEWIRKDLARDAAACLGPVMAPDRGSARQVRFGAPVVREPLAGTPANPPRRSETGTG